MSSRLNNIETVDELIAKLQQVRREAGKNLKLSVSVLQEPHDQPFGTFYEDRQLANAIEVVDDKFVELYV